jgi:hypothetical protein
MDHMADRLQDKPFQIQVNHQGTLAINDVVAGTLLTDIKARVATKLRNERNIYVAAGQIGLWKSMGGELNDVVDGQPVTAGSLGFSGGQQLRCELKGKQGPDAKVVSILEVDLANVCQLQKTFVFLGIGSYDHGHGDASVFQQQCPTALPGLCHDAGLSLLIIHVDPDFAYQFGGQHQLYDIQSGWKLASAIGSEMRSQARRYTHEAGRRLWVYGTCIQGPEYSAACLLPKEVSSVGPARTLVGIDLLAVARAVAGNGGAFLAGNFYSKSVAPYCFAGNPTLLEKLGPPYFWSSRDYG